MQELFCFAYSVVVFSFSTPAFTMCVVLLKLHLIVCSSELCSPNSVEAIPSLLQISNSSIQVENLSVTRSCELFEVGSANGPEAMNPTSLPYSADVQKSTGCSDPEVGLETDKGAYTEATDESIVEEAWQIVNEVFFDASVNSWSPEDWQVPSMYFGRNLKWANSPAGARHVSGEIDAAEPDWHCTTDSDANSTSHSQRQRPVLCPVP